MAIRKGKYIWSSITESGLNNGNYFIEECLKAVLQLPKPDLTVDALRGKFPNDVNDYQLIINPGSTTIYPDNHIYRPNGNTPPIVCFGGSVVWNRFNNIGTASKMHRPVGCRDPYTYHALLNNGISVRFIGCPTLFCIEDNIQPREHVAFSFGKGNIRTQRMLLKHLSKRERVKVLIHEADEEEYCRNLKVDVIQDTQKMLETYYGAKYIVTGRLHAALPGISANRPVFFFQGMRRYDSRLTLLSYLGLPIYDVSDIYKVDFTQIQYNQDRVEKLKQSFTDYVIKFKEEFGK